MSPSNLLKPTKSTSTSFSRNSFSNRIVISDPLGFSSFFIFRHLLFSSVRLDSKPIIILHAQMIRATTHKNPENSVSTALTFLKVSPLFLCLIFTSLFFLRARKFETDDSRFLPFVIGVSRLFFIVRLHLARFDRTVTRLKLHRGSVLAAAPGENARLHGPRGHGEFQCNGNRYASFQ